MVPAWTPTRAVAMGAPRQQWWRKHRGGTHTPAHCCHAAQAGDSSAACGDCGFQQKPVGNQTATTDACLRAGG